MADTNGMADLRGLDVDKLAKGFAEEATVLKRFCQVSKTSAREIRWYQKTSGYLDSSDTTGITGSHIAGSAHKALPVAVEQSWTRKTSYVRKYFVESPLLSEEDIQDSDVDLLATNVRDLVQAVAAQVDTRIYNVLTEDLSPSDIQTSGAVSGGWAGASGNPVVDLNEAKKKIRTERYNPEGAVCYMHPTDHMNLLNWLISTKGSSIPNFSSERVKDGVVMELLGLQVVVSVNATASNILVFVPQRACTWKSFMGMHSVVVSDPGIGRKIRVWEEGEALLTDPKAVHLTTSA